MRKIGWRHTTECVTFPKGGYLPWPNLNSSLNTMSNFANLFNFHISREKILVGWKPEFESKLHKTRIHKRINTTIQDVPAIRVTKGDSWTEHVRGTFSSKFTNVRRWWTDSKKIILEDIHESLIGYNGLMDLQCMDTECAIYVTR
jgi:hypothetical protein